MQFLNSTEPVYQTCFVEKKAVITITYYRITVEEELLTGKFYYDRMEAEIRLGVMQK